MKKLTIFILSMILASVLLIFLSCSPIGYHGNNSAAANYDPLDDSDHARASTLVSDKYEPDDTIETAKAFPEITGAIQTHTIDVSDDVDYIKFKFYAGHSYQFSAVSKDKLEPEMSLLDSSGNLVAYNDDNEINNAFITFFCERSDTYYIKVNSFNHLTVGSYYFYFTLISVLPDYPDAFEPDNSFQDASQYNWLQGYRHQTLNNYHDVDYVKFEGTAEYESCFSIDTHQCGLEVSLYDTDVVTLIRAFYIDANTESRNFSYPCAIAGTYYLKIKHHGHFTPSNYELTINSGGLPDPDIFEQNENLDSAKEIHSGEFAECSIHTPGDKDYYKFWAIEGNKYSFITTQEVNYWTGVQPDTDIILLNKSGTRELYSQDHRGPSTSFDWMCHSTGYYYLLVYGHDPVFTTGNYTLQYYVEKLSQQCDAYEPDDSSYISFFLNTKSPELFNHSIHVQGDVDWYVIKEADVGNYTISVTTADNTDIEMTLWNKERTNIIAYVNDLGASTAILTFTFEELTSEYFLEVKGYQNSSTGAYQLL